MAKKKVGVQSNPAQRVETAAKTTRMKRQSVVKESERNSKAKPKRLKTKKQPTKAELRRKEYNKQRKRVERLVKRLENRGYDFGVKSPLPKEVKFPTDKSIQRLKEINAKKLYEKARYIDTETGELIPAVEHQKEVRREAAKRAAETRRIKKEQAKRQQEEYTRVLTDEQVAVSTFQRQINEFPNARLAPVIQQWFSGLISQFGQDRVGEMLIEGSSHGYGFFYGLLYDGVYLSHWINGIMDYMPDAGNIEWGSFYDALDESENWDDYFTPDDFR